MNVVEIVFGVVAVAAVVFVLVGFPLVLRERRRWLLARDFAARFAALTSSVRAAAVAIAGFGATAVQVSAAVEGMAKQLDGLDGLPELVNELDRQAREAFVKQQAAVYSRHGWPPPDDPLDGNPYDMHPVEG